jgi:transketolase
LRLFEVALFQDCSPLGWHRDAGASGIVLGMQTFGMSAPMEVVTKQFGFTTDTAARWAMGATH